MIWYEKLKHLDARDFRAAIQLFENTKSGLPVPQDLINLADDARARRAAHEMRQDRVQAARFLDPKAQTSSIARNSTAFMALLLDFKGSPEEKLKFEIEGYQKLNLKYPAAGFGESYQDAVRRLKEMQERKAA